LPPWTMTVDQSYSIHKLGYEYMLASYVYPTESSVPIAKFKSANANVHPVVLQKHRRAEVRLHKVQYVSRAGFHIRVFLNSPEANASTPIRDNDHFVGQVNTFMGFCIGGPGHCDLPKETRSKFDQRPRAHKTPGNFRLDATDAVTKLRAQGDTDFQVNLVVLNTDGTLATDALKLDAVSLNFID
jgi:tyrosinase